MPKIKIIVTGKVQGVCYRAFTADQAQTLAIDGTVKNLPDGSVEIIATGEQDRLDALISSCRQGPSAAQVDSLEISRLSEAEGEWVGFHVVR